MSGPEVRHTCNRRAEGTVRATMAGWKRRRRGGGKVTCKACSMAGGRPGPCR